MFADETTKATGTMSTLVITAVMVSLETKTVGNTHVKCLILLSSSGIAQPVERIATGWTIQKSNHKGR
jgi:hypothetical protein